MPEATGNLEVGNFLAKFRVADQSTATASSQRKLAITMYFTVSKMKRIALIVLIGLGSIVLGFFLMMPLGLLFDAMNWPLFHTWGLAHGSFVIAWPVLALVSFGLLHVLIRAWRQRTSR